MKWYNDIAWLYDGLTTAFYNKARQKLIDALDIQPNDRILIIACGTGQSFALIEQKLQGSGQVIGLDSSSAMLKRASKRINSHSWQNITLLQADARDISKVFFQQQGINADFDIVIGELAFSVIPAWQAVMHQSVELLVHHGRLGVLDWFCRKSWVSAIVNMLAQADISRNSLAQACKLIDGFKVVEHCFFNCVYVGVGKKQT